MISKYLNPQNDVAFKRIFGQPKNKDILIAMINTVLQNQIHKPIKNVTFLSPIQEPEAAAKKQSIVDVLCKDQDGCQYIIEMQIAQAAGFQERAQYYAARAFTQQAGEGCDYQDLKEIIFLAFCNFPIFPNKKEYKSEHVLLDNKTLERDLDKFSFTFIDLPKFDKQRKKDISALPLEEKFYYFLSHAKAMSDKELRLLAKKDPIIQKAFYELERFNWSENEMRLYEREEKRVKDNKAVLDYAKQKGREEGREEGKKDAIASLLRQGVITKEQAEKALEGLDSHWPVKAVSLPVFTSC